MFLSRREMLSRSGTGLGMLGLAGVMADAGLTSANAATNPMAAKRPHFAAKAKHVIHVFANGGLSHVDSFDRKVALDKYDGKSIPMDLRTERKTGAAMKSPYSFKKYGQCGHEISEIFPNIAASADDLCFINSMYANVPNHEPSLMLMNCGEQRQPRPSMGSWVTYGLGTENQNLPGFIAMCPHGMPIKQSDNWRSSFLPGVLQGTYLNMAQKDLDKLIANIRPSVTSEKQRRQLDVLQQLNRRHAEVRPHDDGLNARIQSFELAFRMQRDAEEAFDLAREPKHIQDAYGIHRKNGHEQARSLLTARRLVERGVRYVQIWQGAGQPWDNHDHLKDNHRKLAEQIDQPLGALIQDLKTRGLLDETLILFVGEFGRTPVVELPTPGANAGTMTGRDHNHYGFTAMLAGGGVKAGTRYGATDEFGFKAVENRVHVHDLHATMLKLLGFDHEKLTYRYAGRDFRLTDIHGRVVDEVIA